MYHLSDAVAAAFSCHELLLWNIVIKSGEFIAVIINAL